MGLHYVLHVSVTCIACMLGYKGRKLITILSISWLETPTTSYIKSVVLLKLLLLKLLVVYKLKTTRDLKQVYKNLSRQVQTVI